MGALFAPKDRSLNDYNDRVMSPEDGWVVGFVHWLANDGTESEIRSRLKMWAGGLDVKNVSAREKLVAKYGQYFE